MGSCRPRTLFVKQTNARVCPRCGAKINNQLTRCKRCTEPLSKPVSRKGKKSKFRQARKRW